MNINTTFLLVLLLLLLLLNSLFDNDYVLYVNFMFWMCWVIAFFLRHRPDTDIDTDEIIISG